MLVKQHPGPNDCGIRFYRPKPFLFIGPAESKAEKSSAIQPVVIRLDYLPDYEEEYSIRMTPGLGQADLNVALEHGWNLTSVNAKTDQRYAEIIGSVAQLAGAASKLVYETKVTVDLDVPLGYYEAVLATNEMGRKQMLGWRYVGFMPFLTNPVNARIFRSSVPCGEGDLFALISEAGTLRMRRMSRLLEEKEHVITIPKEVPSSEVETIAAPAIRNADAE
jgi:hypothetical protein